MLGSCVRWEPAAGKSKAILDPASCQWPWYSVGPSSPLHCSPRITFSCHHWGHGDSRSQQRTILPCQQSPFHLVTLLQLPTTLQLDHLLFPWLVLNPSPWPTLLLGTFEGRKEEVPTLGGKGERGSQKFRRKPSLFTPGMTDGSPAHQV